MSAIYWGTNFNSETSLWRGSELLLDIEYIGYESLTTSIRETAECSNCDIRGRDEDIWHSVFECPIF